MSRPAFLALRVVASAAGQSVEVASIRSNCIDRVAVYVTGHFPAPGEPPLSEPERLTVVDQNGLTGDYDYTVDLTHSHDCFLVLESQLGPEPRGDPVDMLIIDRSEE